MSLSSWNQKFLDYEIETAGLSACPLPTISSWNQKFLDYEIETYVTHGKEYRTRMLESKVSRLRD